MASRGKRTPTARSSIHAADESWLPGVRSLLGFYVYLLIDPRGNRVFYVGKGTRNRCFAHVAWARKTKAKASRGFEKLETIRQIEARGDGVRIDVLRYGLDESTAFAIETAAIELLGLDDLSNKVAGHDSQRMTATDVNAHLGAKPAVFRRRDRIVLIRIARRFHPEMSDRELYDAARRWWRIGPDKRALGSSTAPEWAFAVHEGVIRAVYRLTRWVPAGKKDIAVDPRRQGRWSFVGDRDPKTEARYLLRDVTAELPQGNQNPLRFINCGRSRIGS